MTIRTKIKRFILVGILALSLLLGTLNVGIHLKRSMPGILVLIS